MAASVVNNILSEPYVFEEWPHCDNEIMRNTIKGTIMIDANKKLVQEVVG